MAEQNFLFEELISEAGKQKFFRYYGRAILKHKRTRGQYLFTLCKQVRFRLPWKEVLYGKPECVNVFFWQSGYNLGVIAKCSVSGEETFIDL